MSESAVPMRRRLWLPASFILAFNVGLMLLLILKPGGTTFVTTADNLAQFIGPLLALPLAFGGPRGLAGRLRSGRHGWAPIFLGLGAFGFVAGQMIWAYYELILREATPFPSLADVGFMACYPFLMLGVLLIPTRRMSWNALGRITLDGLMLLAALMTFSWYFILGPTILAGGETFLARFVGTAYPVWDLVLIACLFVLAARSRDGVSWPALGVLAVGLGACVVADTVFDYATIQGTYATGALIDVGWPLGYMLVALGARVVRWDQQVAVGVADSRDEPQHSPSRRLWGSMMLYLLVPAVAALLAYVLHGAADKHLLPGVEIGAGILVALVVARQILAIDENRRLTLRLQAKNEELAIANIKLQGLATTDPLTDLANHRAIVDGLDRELERARRYSRPCAVLFVDLDHFKALNDSFGHPAGDAALSQLATVMRLTLRGIDILGRWGGEEFVAILPESSRDVAVAVGERLRSAVAGHSMLGGTAHLTCSIGVAVYPDDAASRGQLVEMADRALYAAKKLGRNQVRAARDPAIEMIGLTTGAEPGTHQADLIRTAEALASLVAARDLYTGQHTQSVAQLTAKLALDLGLTGQDVQLVRLAGRLHDIGKIAVPDAVLRKPAPLTAEEWALLRMHPVVGADVVARLPAIGALSPLIRGHHERWDGAGYPDRLRGESIPLGARIVAVADAFGAMTSDRPYRMRVEVREAIEEIKRCSGTQFDPRVVRALEHVLGLEDLSERLRAG